MTRKRNRKTIRMAAVICILAFFICVFGPGEKAGAEAADHSALSALSFDVRIDEASGQVESCLILENTGEKEAAANLTLPLISAGMKAESLQVQASREAVLEADGSLSFTLLTGETISISYSYETGQNLSHAGVIGMDLRELVFCEGGTIGRFSFSLTLKEEDLPLVRQIFPMNWKLQEKTISFCLYNVQPNALLDRIYVSKETWRDLKGSRDFEPNEEQQFLLSHYREWFENGLGAEIEEKKMPDREEERFFAELMNLPITDEPFYLQSEPAYGACNRLKEGNDIYKTVFDYLYLRECQRAGVELLVKDDDYWAGYRSRIDLNLNGMPEVMKELLRQEIFGDECFLAVVAYEKTPSLEDVSLYRIEIDYSADYSIHWKPIQLEKALHAVPEGMDSLYFDGHAALPYRVMLLDMEEAADKKQLQGFLDTVDAEIFTIQSVLDDREGQWLFADEFPACFLAAAGESNLSRQTLQNCAENVSEWTVVKTMLQEDADWGTLTLPAFKQYTGGVTLKDDMAVYTNFGGGNYLAHGYGLPFYAAVAGSDEGRAINEARYEMLNTERAALDARIEEQLALSRTPVKNDPSVLSVLACDVEIDEAASSVYTELVLENTLSESVSCGIRLPLVSNGTDAAGIRLEEEGLESALLSDGTLDLSLSGGQIRRIRYRYQTKSSLIHAGIIGMDFGQLVFSPEGRIGRFSVSLSLREEDIPLVDEIFPANYTFDGQTLSLELYDFAPNSLLNRFYLAKTSYRALRGGLGAETELTPGQQYVLAHCREWFRDGLDLDKESAALVSGNLYDALQQLMGPGADPKIVGPFHYGIETGPPYYARILYHLILREAVRKGIRWDLAYWGGMATEQSIGILSRRLLYDMQGHRKAARLIAVEYARTDSLAGVSLVREHPSNTKVAEYDRIQEMAFIRSAWDRAFYEARLNARLTEIPSGVSADELREYLRAIGAELYIRVAMLDNRDGAYDRLKITGYDNQQRFLSDCFAVPAGGALTADELRNAFFRKDEVGTDKMVFEQEDEILAACGIPAFIQYHAYVEEKDSMTVVRTFDGHRSALSGPHGLAQWGSVLMQDGASACLKAFRAEREAAKETVLKKLETVKP